MIIVQFLIPSIPTVHTLLHHVHYKWSVVHFLYTKGWKYNEWMVCSLMQSTTKITTFAGPEGGHATINQKALIPGMKR